MLKKLFALSDQGERELKHGIVATTIGHLCIMAPISLLMLVTMGLLNRLCGETGLTMQPGVIVLMAAVLLLLIFITQWVQYNLTYKVAYEESANRRITLAEKLRRLPLAFFGQRDLSDLTTTMMGDCSKLERIFFQCGSQSLWHSHYVCNCVRGAFDHGLAHGAVHCSAGTGSCAYVDGGQKGPDKSGKPQL